MAKARPSRRLLRAIAVVAIALAVAVVARHLIVRALIEGVVSLATGYDVRFDDQRLGSSHAAFIDVRVHKGGDPVLSAPRVDIAYVLRDVLPGGRHRFGLAAVSMTSPVVTITRHTDGTMTFNPGGGAAPASSPAPSHPGATPLLLTARIRDGEVDLVDAAPLQPDLARQRIIDVNVDASIDSNARTTAHAAATLLARRSSGALLTAFPLDIRTLVDVRHGLTLTKLRAGALPLRGPLAYFIHTKSVRFDDGVVTGVDASAYALAQPGFDFGPLTLAGTFALQGGRIKVPALARPLRDLAAPFTLTDGALSTPALRGSIGGMPLHGSGALFDLFGVPRFRMAIAGDGDLGALRSVFAFSSKLPISGPIHLETLLQAQLGKPFIRTWVRMSRVAYAHYPVDGVSGYVDYYNLSLLVPGMHARYGSAAVNVAGRIDFAHGADVAMVASAHGNGSALPYTSAFAPDAAIDATALITEPPGNKFAARGTVAATGGTSGGMTFDVDQYGVGTFGPFSFSRRDGSSLAGAFELNRPISASTGWLHLRGFRLAAVRSGIGLPGARIPQLPPIAGILDGDFAGGGTPSSFGLAGSLHGRELAVSGYPIGNGSVTLGGTATDLRLQKIRVDGPLGRFAGDGAYGNGTFGVEGRYDGRLAQLARFTGDVADGGEVHGPVRAVVIGSRIAIQTTGTDLPGGDVRGVPVQRIAGTIVVDGRDLRIVAADGTVAGSRAVAADIGGPFLISAPTLDAGALHAAGLPLQAGRLAVFGSADVRAGAPQFDGAVALDGGRSDGYAVSGATEIALSGSTATVRAGTAALGSTYAAFDGSVDGVGRTNAYDLRADVPIGDIAAVRRALHLSLRTLEGSFGARVHVGGAGASPRVAGNVNVPEGSYNGLAFRDARARVVIGASSATVRDGVVTVGSTHAQIAGDARFRRRSFALRVASSDANLSDFNDYFDEAETLAGTGSIAASFSDLGTRIRSSGRLALNNLRYRRIVLGTTGAQWSQHGTTIAAALAVRSPHGSLHATAAIVPAPGALAHALRAADYHATLDAHDVDLATWLPIARISAPVLGSVDAHAVANGRLPNLTVAADATLAGGTVFGYRVHEATLHATTDGSSIALTNSSLDLGFARFDLGGTIGFARVPPLALSLHVVTPDIATAIATAFPNSPRYDLGGRLEADARITGTLEDPRVAAGFNVTGARYASLAVPQILGSATYDGRTLEVDDVEATFAKGKLLVAGSLPLDLAAMSIDQSAPFSFTLGVTALDLAPFAPYVPGTHTTLGGTIDGRLAVEGTFRAPRIVGNATLANGSYRSDFDRAGVTGAGAQLTFEGTSVTLATLHAKLGSGTVDGHGSLDLPFPGVHTSGYTIDVTAHGAQIDSPQYGRGTLDGTLQVAAAETMPVISGNLTLDNASIPVSAVFRSASSSGAGGPPFDVGFNLKLTAGRNVRVQSSIIDVGATGALDLTGSLTAPMIGGVLTATPGGIFSTYNRTFRIQSAVVSFDPSRGVIPFVDLRATAHVTNPDPDPTRNALGSADITVAVLGPADELAKGSGITFSSNPPYSQEQILGLLLDASLFGAVNFAQAQNGTGLPGAPGESNALLPPGTTPLQAGTINFNQEAFSVLNGQFTQRFLAPFERFLGGALNLTDIELTVDYGGGVGYNALKQIGKDDLYLNFGQTLSYPVRTTAGLTARPNATTSIDLNYFTQDGNPAITYDENGTQPFSYVQRLHGIQPLSGRQGFTFLVVRKYP